MPSIPVTEPSTRLFLPGERIFALYAAFFVLYSKSHTIYPYAHFLSNVPNRAATLKRVQIQDVLPSDLPPGSNFPPVAGDFKEVYGQQDGEADPNEPSAGLWGAILTCFFTDTAKNIVDYLRIIHRILSPRGIWINLGPLLWHFEEDTTSDPSVELYLEEVKALAAQIGSKSQYVLDVRISFVSYWV
ncbi:N2227-like protein [Lactifluus subvellereus]|nr:N2227-like protein [Lactifluus subvellereus]